MRFDINSILQKQKGVKKGHSGGDGSTLVSVKEKGYRQKGVFDQERLKGCAPCRKRTAIILNISSSLCDHQGEHHQDSECTEHYHLELSDDPPPFLSKAVPLASRPSIVLNLIRESWHSPCSLKSESFAVMLSRFSVGAPPEVQSTKAIRMSNGSRTQKSHNPEGTEL